jgi:hypothetical protein
VARDRQRAHSRLGIATVRFKVEDGKLKALDPIPNP